MSDQIVAKAANYTTHDKHKKPTSMHSTRFEPVIPAVKQLEAYTVDHKATGIDRKSYTRYVQVLRSPKEAFAAAMQSWRERCEKCVCLQSDYVEK